MAQVGASSSNPVRPALPLGPRTKSQTSVEVQVPRRDTSPKPEDSLALSPPTLPAAEKTTVTVAPAETVQVQTAPASSPQLLDFESGAVGAALLSRTESRPVPASSGEFNFETTETTRKTVGWAGEPTLEAPLGQSHRRLIAQGIAYMDKVAPGLRRRLDHLVDPEPDPARAQRGRELIDEQNQMFTDNAQLLNYPDGYVKEKMPEQFAKKQALEKRLGEITTDWEKNNSAIESLEYANARTATGLMKTFLGRLRSQNAADAVARDASSAIVLGPGAERALAAQAIEPATLKGWVNEFHHQTGLPKPERLEFRHTGKRPEYWASEDFVNVGDDFSKRMCFHEVAHRAEHRNPEVSLASKDFVRARAKNSGHSTSEGRLLSEITGSDFYGKDEKALENHFINPYVGRQYPDASTEVLSVGLEQFDSPERLLNFYRRDPEHFFLTLGSLETLKKSGW